MKMQLQLLMLLFWVSFFGSGQERKGLTQLDTIFSVWDEAGTPGLAGAIVKNGRTVYLHAVGTANLEHDSKVTPKTAFQVDELSKQFTSLAFLLLEKQGKISWEDPIQKYLPQFPVFEHPLKLRHLLNHSTGLNDYSVVKSLKGKTAIEAFSSAEALDLLLSQAQLNFKPGTDFSYFTSDTESLLMSLVIRKATGKSLNKYAKEFIFVPLGMVNTVFREDRSQLVKNKAASYRREGEKLLNNPVYDEVAGPTNLYTTAEDLAIWYEQFHKNKGELSQFIHKLNEPVTLDNGVTYDSYWGRLTFGRDFYHFERGAESYWHFGMVGGYSASVFRFPNEAVIAIAIGNNMQYNGATAMRLANHFMEAHYSAPASVEVENLELKKVPTKKLKSYEGFYWYPKRGLARKVSLKNDTLRLSATDGDYETPLLPLSDTKFQLAVEGDEQIFLDFEPKNDSGQKRYEFRSGIAHPKYYLEYEPKTYSANELQEFSGNYYNESYAIGYEFKVEEGSLTTQHKVHGDIAFEPLMEDIFNSNILALANIRFTRNEKGVVNGFTIYTDGLQKVYFTKQKDSAI